MFYVIQVLAGTEHQVEYRCKQMMHKEEEVFIPHINMRKRIRGVDEQIQRPMFPGYVFFDTTEIDDLFFRLKKIKTFTKLLKTGDEFTPLYPEEEALIRHLGGGRHIVEMSIGFKDGDKVTITEGPLAGLESKIKSIKRTKRAAVLMVPLMGEMREVTLGLVVLNK